MPAMEVPARIEGRKAMEDSLTRAEQVRRKLKAGPRYRNRTFEVISPLEAVYRAAEKAKRARAWMQEEGLLPCDISVGLVWVTTTDAQNANPGEFNAEWLPTTGNVGALLAALEDKAEKNIVLFPGLLWWQVDRARAAPSPITFWISQWINGPTAEVVLRAVRAQAIENTRKNHGGK